MKRTVTPALLADSIRHSKKYVLPKLESSIKWMGFFKTELLKRGIKLDEEEYLDFSPKALLKRERKRTAEAEESLEEIKRGLKARPQLSLDLNWENLMRQRDKIDEAVDEIEWLRPVLEEKYGDPAELAAVCANHLWEQNGGEPILVTSLDVNDASEIVYEPERFRDLYLDESYFSFGDFTE